jgi:hypothetical protein
MNRGFRRSMLGAIAPRVVKSCVLAGLALSVAPLRALAQDSEHQPKDLVLRTGELNSLRIISADRESFGIVRVHSNIVRKLNFGNVLSVPLHIEIVSKSCGCMQAALSSTDVPAGGQTTLTMSVGVAPLSGEQAHSVVFRASWNDQGERKSELGLCGIQYQADVQVVVRPETAATSVTRGNATSIDFFARALEKGVEVSVSHVSCSIPGWVIGLVDDPSLPAEAVHIRAVGPGLKEGYLDGEVALGSGPSTEPFLKVPVRVRVLEPYRAEPGGAILVRNEGDGEAEQVLRLRPRDQASGLPKKVRLTSDCKWISVGMQSPDQVKVRFTPGAGISPIGSARAQVLADSGEVLLDFPIAWYTRPAPYPPAKDTRR